MNIVGLSIMFLSTVYAANIVKDVKNFGPFDVPIIRNEFCKGGKQAVARVSANFELVNNDWIGRFNSTYPEQTKLDQLKMAVYLLKNNRKTLLYTYKLNEPCKHFLFASFIQEMHNSTGCTIKKGFYSSKYNLTEILRSLLGSSFFFGEYVFKTNISSKNGSICCFITNISITKKEESSKKNN